MGNYPHGWSSSPSRTFVSSAHSTRRSVSSDSTWPPPTMQGPTSTCASAGKAVPCTNGYGRHSLVSRGSDNGAGTEGQGRDCIVHYTCRELFTAGILRHFSSRKDGTMLLNRRLTLALAAL